MIWLKVLIAKIRVWGALARYEPGRACLFGTLSVFLLGLVTLTIGAVVALAGGGWTVAIVGGATCAVCMGILMLLINVLDVRSG